MVLSLNKEISDLSEKYQKHVIPGASVQHFNDIIDQITVNFVLFLILYVYNEFVLG